MTIQIHGADYPIRKIFSDEFAFTIPLYQRPYAWTTEEADELFSDLASVVDENPDASIDQLDPYFLGSIVLIKESNAPEAEVIDGQQRLTTLTILLACLRHVTSSASGDDLQKYLYEKGDAFAQTTDRFRLTVRQRDEAFFRQYVQEKGGLEKLRQHDSVQLSDSQKNFRENSALFIERLTERGDAWVHRLAAFLIQRCSLVAVSTPDINSAYRIFSVLNERGLDLSHADILKSEAIGRISDDQQEQYAKRWEDIEQGLGRDAFADLLAYIRTIVSKRKLKTTVLESFRDSVIKRYPDPIQLIDQAIQPYADAYAIVRDQAFESREDAEPINAVLGWLNRLGNADWVPPAVLTIALHRHDPGRCLTILRDLERLAASMLVRRINITKRIERYGKVLQALEDKKDLCAAESPLQLDDQEKLETLEALGGHLYALQPVRLYVLLRLDASLSSGGATYDYSKITVEHVLPQNPSCDSEWDQQFDKTEQISWVHRVANLVLLTRNKNSAAQNYDFAKKKAKYFTGRGGVSPFQLTTQVLNTPVWDMPTLEKRQGELLQRLKKIWRLA